MELIKEITDKLEEYDWNVYSLSKQGNDYIAEIGQSTPAGEDWFEAIWFDGTKNGFVDGVRREYENFDVDEEVEVWIEGRGKNGVPNSIRTLVEDAEWKDEKLLELAGVLENEVYSEEEGDVPAWKD